MDRSCFCEIKVIYFFTLMCPTTFGRMTARPSGPTSFPDSLLDLTTDLIPLQEQALYYNTILLGLWHSSFYEKAICWVLSVKGQLVVGHEFLGRTYRGWEWEGRGCELSQVNVISSTLFLPFRDFNLTCIFFPLDHIFYLARFPLFQNPSFPWITFHQKTCSKTNHQRNPSQPTRLPRNQLVAQNPLSQRNSFISLSEKT